MRIPFKIFFIINALLIAPPLFSQTPTSVNLDSIKTIAIYSSTKSFFNEYSIDSLVKHLNELNRNRNLIYFKNTEDKTRSGNYADYLVDLSVWTKSAINEGTKIESSETIETETRVEKLRDGSTQFITENIKRPIYKIIYNSVIPGEGTLNIKIRDKNRNGKLTTNTITKSSKIDENIRAQLIIELINYLMYHFSK